MNNQHCHRVNVNSDRNRNRLINPLQELITMLLTEQFSKQINEITDIILQYNSQLTLNQIKEKVSLNPAYINEIIVLLQNHAFITVENSKYTLETKRILQVLQYPQLLYIINMQYGPIGVSIVEHVMYKGVTSAKKLLRTANDAVDISSNEESIKEILLRLIEDKWLKQYEKKKVSNGFSLNVNDKASIEKEQEKSTKDINMAIEENALLYNSDKGKCNSFFLNNEYITKALNNQLIEAYVNQQYSTISSKLVMYLINNIDTPTSNCSIKNILSHFDDLTEGDLQSLLAKGNSNSNANSSNKLFMANQLEEHSATTIVALNKALLVNQMRQNAIETIVSEQFTPNHVRVYRIISLSQWCNWEHMLNYAMLTPLALKQVLDQLHGHHYIKVFKDEESNGKERYSVNMSSALLTNCIAKIYKAIKTLKHFFNVELSAIDNHVSPLMQEQYMNYTAGEVRRLNDIVASLELNEQRL